MVPVSLQLFANQFGGYIFVKFETAAMLRQLVYTKFVGAQSGDVVAEAHVLPP